MLCFRLRRRKKNARPTIIPRARTIPIVSPALAPAVIPVGCSWDLAVVVVDDDASNGAADDELAVTASWIRIDVVSVVDVEDKEVLLVKAAVEEVRNVVGCCEELEALLVLTTSRDGDEDASADREFCKGVPLATGPALDAMTTLDELAADLEF